MRKKRFWLLPFGLLIGLGPILAACGPIAGLETHSPLSTPPTANPPRDATAMPVEPGEVLALVQRDLARRVDLTEDQIRVVSIKAVQWPDSSLGCPKPGMMYAQVITPGYEIVLQAGGQEFTYHTGADSFVLCTEGSETGGAGMNQDRMKERELDPQAAALVEEAKRDLAKRLNLGVDDIHVQSVEAVQWRNSSLGCPKPGMNYLMVITPGYRIILSARGREYDYHSSLTTVSLCQQ